MATVEAPVELKGLPVPSKTEDRIRRARDRAKLLSRKRQECFEFWRGNQYVFVNDENYLVKQSTVTSANGRGKPAHRVRTVRNLIIDVVAHEVSAATQRVPSYQVGPTTSDPQDVSAAHLAEKIALYGYDKWNVRQAIVKLVTQAVVGDEGFVWAYWDPSKGPPVDAEQGIGQGEICFHVFGANEVFWEPGVRFEDSPFHVIEQARPVDEVLGMPGYIGGPLKPDATSDDTLASNKDRQSEKLVMVTEYLERPTIKAPNGRWLTIAGGKTILPPANYPGETDDPVLHKLAYFVDPDNDRDMGLVRHLIDAQRIYNVATNKQTEWMNLALNPQVIMSNMTLKERLTDEPGAVYTAWGSGSVTWRPVPPIPPELSRIKEEAQNDIARIAAQNNIPNQVDSGKGIQALVEKDANRRQDFIASLADVHGRLMRTCLYLVQQHYTEKRLIGLRGEFGWEPVRDFLGSQLRDQTDVYVLPDSIEPRTREAIQAKVLAFADRGWISPEAAMAAINGGTAESLVEDYERDVAWQNYEIQLIRGFPVSTNGQVPKARSFDNHKVHLQVLHSWMKTSDFAMAAPSVQEAATIHEEMHQQMEADAQAQAMAAQTAQAEQQGMTNAARPQGAKASPTMPGGSPPLGGSQPNPQGP